MEILTENPLLLGLVRVLLLVVPILLLVPGLIWWERRLLSWFQDRIGPNRTGTITIPDNFKLGPVKWENIPWLGKKRKIRTFGLIQPIADGVKLFLKEDITPSSIDRKIYFIAPAIALFPAFALGATLPWGPNYGPYGLLTPIANLEIGLLYILAISSLGVYGVVLAGYASNNKYSLMGGLRASAQLISYELAMGVALASIVLAVGSLKMTELVAVQEQALYGAFPAIQNWFILTPFGFIAAIIFLIAMVAETNRAPFDLPEAENELIAGYHTEYSSMKFAVFFMGEYAAMFVFSAVFATVFLGGYNLVPVNWAYLADAYPGAAGVFNAAANAQYWLAPLFFLAKTAAAFSMFIWLRATLPRLRYDQLMNLGWKSLLPAAVANFIVVGIWIIATRLSEEAGYGATGGWAAVAVAVLILVVLYLNILNAGRRRAEESGETEERAILLVDPNPPTRRVTLVD
jgi:NADH-quinone oxidoreductase subunit H